MDPVARAPHLLQQLADIRHEMGFFGIRQQTGCPHHIQAIDLSGDAAAFSFIHQDSGYPDLTGKLNDRGFADIENSGEQWISGLPQRRDSEPVCLSIGIQPCETPSSAKDLIVHGLRQIDRLIQAPQSIRAISGPVLHTIAVIRGPSSEFS